MRTRPRGWWNGIETQRTTTSRTRSVAYDKLVRSQLRADPADLEGATATRVPNPFHEAFDHPRSRIDVDASWFAPDLLGRVGLAVAVAVMLLALLMVALATGVYRPAGEPASSQMIDSAVPQRTVPAGK